MAAEVQAHNDSYTNYAAYRDPKTLGQSRIGHLDLQKSTIQPLSFQSGAPLSDLYQVIEIGESDIKPSELLPPISGRDILAVGKNYAEHATEFNSPGYDSSDKVDQPAHPVIFTKRSTSITVDYEGEIGVIIGKSGFRVSEKDAWDYVWGYTIINDVTARERQRDHKQFYIGKSPDTFCPMGPIAVPAHKLPKSLQVETTVNGEKRQTASTSDLIFSIPFLVQTLSEGQTLQPGDVIATGTPAGVGFGQKPPVFLQPGDVVEVSVTGLGVLKNTIAELSDKNQTISRVAKETHVPINNLNKSCGGAGLSTIGSKYLYYRHAGVATMSPIIFIHGLGGSSEFYTPLIAALGLEKSHSLHLLDIEGHGLSPTSATSTISIESYAADFDNLAKQKNIKSATIIANSMGCLVAMTLAVQYPALVSNLVLIGPPPLPFPEAGRNGLIARAATLRSLGMAAVVDAVTADGTSSKSKADNPVAIAAIRMSLLGQDPEGYAKGCTALAGASEALPVRDIKVKTLIITGEEDKASPPQVCEKYAREIKGAQVQTLPQVGHWHTFEDLNEVAKAVGDFL
ncbi:Uncharacterized protein LSUE1_G005823 [Lachnellula suecica]|uniref:Fumarylacetoacetate hydrolase n=1 Tax=Lachnellula suecica TaxID=602035 RepID=A0A8T9C0A2_9HELO|nr:Uncharacterized protein LSUE1_G005823 [Lachnellula suecica]